MTNLEEIARAIAWAGLRKDWGQMGYKERQMCHLMAREAVRTMRDPGWEIMNAAKDCARPWQIEGVWEAMIDAILEEIDDAQANP